MFQSSMSLMCCSKWRSTKAISRDQHGLFRLASDLIAGRWHPTNFRHVELLFIRASFAKFAVQIGYHSLSNTWPSLVDLVAMKTESSQWLRC